MKQEKLIIRIPNWLGDICMAMPIIRSLQNNFELSFFGQEKYQCLFSYFQINAKYINLPNKNLNIIKYLREVRKLRINDIKQGISFTNSQRTDLELIMLGLKSRYGIAWKSRKRFLINNKYMIEHPLKDARHQTELLADFVDHFKLINKNTVNYSPLINNPDKKNQLVLITGSENTPEKRLSAESWSELILQMRDLEKINKLEIILCGSKADIEQTNKILFLLKNHIDNLKISNMTAKTDLVEFCQILSQSKLVIGNDTGGLHLANALGTPSIGLFGPTNPLRSKPIFNSSLKIILPENCPNSGGGRMSDIKISQIIQAINEIEITN